MAKSSKNNHKTPEHTRTDYGSDNSRRAAGHGMHEQEIFRTFGLTDQIFKKVQTAFDTLLPA
jgi:hypothetical protein